MNVQGGLPPAWYCEGDAFQHEKRTLFATSWQLFASASNLREPGEFVTGSLGGWPVFALVDADGRIGAFRNVCRHQGMQVLERPRGRCETLRCRYHGWTYDLAGRMVSAPDLVAPPNPRSSDNHLCRIACATLGPLVYVNLDTTAAPLGAALGELAPALVSMFDGRAVQGEVATDYNCNWKTYVEHCLAVRTFGTAGRDGAWLLQWPLAMFEPTAHAAHVQQIVPRTFARTRVIEYVCAADATQAHAAIDAARQRGLADKAACEALQARREAGDGAEAPLANFHDAIREVHARAPRIEPLQLQQGVA